MGSISSAMCADAKDIFLTFASVPGARACAEAVDDGKGDSDAIGKAAQAWDNAARQLRAFHGDLEGVVHGVSESEWEAADREAYEQTANSYLDQLSTSAANAESVSVALHAAEEALVAYAAAAVGIATFFAAKVMLNNALPEPADCSADPATAKNQEAANEAHAQLEAAGTTLKAALGGIAGTLGGHMVMDQRSLKREGDSAVGGDSRQATLAGVKADVSLAADKAVDKVKDDVKEKVLDSVWGSFTGGDDSDDDGQEDCEPEPKPEPMPAPKPFLVPNPGLNGLGDEGAGDGSGILDGILSGLVDGFA